MEQLVGLFNFSGGDTIPLTNEQVYAYITMLTVSLLFGVILHFLYSVYFRESEPTDASLSRSLVLLTPSLMTLFWFVQFSLPLSVGLLGTLSFVRFRSPVKRAEDISFIVIALACAVSCAISKPVIGAILVLVFLGYSFVRNSFVSRFFRGLNFGVLTYNTKKNISIGQVEKSLLESQCKKFQFISSRRYDGITSFVFNITNLDTDKLTKLIELLEKADETSNISVFYPNNRISG